RRAGGRLPGAPRSDAVSDEDVERARHRRPTAALRGARPVCCSHRNEQGGVMNAGPAVATALTFVWLGMVLAISFLEAPLKFRAPGVTLQIGLGIGRLVFRALNVCEAVLAAVILVALFLDVPPVAAEAALLVAVAALMIQVSVVRRALTRRTAGVLAG